MAKERQIKKMAKEIYLCSQVEMTKYAIKAWGRNSRLKPQLPLTICRFVGIFLNDELIDKVDVLLGKRKTLEGIDNPKHQNRNIFMDISLRFNDPKHYVYHPPLWENCTHLIGHGEIKPNDLSQRLLFFVQRLKLH